MSFVGWEAEYDTGQIFKEGNLEWTSLKRNKIIRLSLLYHGRRWDINGKREYIQKKKASIIPGINNKVFIESRSIGYYDVENNCKVYYTLDVNTGQMKIETEDLK